MDRTALKKGYSAHWISSSSPIPIQPHFPCKHSQLCVRWLQHTLRPAAHLLASPRSSTYEGEFLLSRVMNLLFKAKFSWQMDDVSDSNSLTIHFVALLPQNVSGERMRPLTRDEGTKLVAHAMAGKGKMYRVDLLQALQRFVGLDHLQLTSALLSSLPAMGNQHFPECHFYSCSLKLGPTSICTPISLPWCSRQFLLWCSINFHVASFSQYTS